MYTAEMNEEEEEQLRADAADARISARETDDDRLFDEGRYQ